MRPNRILLLLLAATLFSCNKETNKELPTVSINSLEVSEGNVDNTIYVNFLLSREFDEPVTLIVSTKDGMAEAGEDYLVVQDQTLVFAPFDLAESLEITVFGDVNFEPDEEFYLEVTSSQNVLVDPALSSTPIKLLNDDTGDWTMIWNDEFDGLQLNTENWTFETGGNGWGNNELQYYTNSNTQIINGNLVIEARNESVGGRDYTSSRVVTKDKFEFQYGRVDIKAALPEGQGLWPALWMLGANISEVGWPACGEIDIMEMIGGSGREKTVHGTLHWQDPGGDAGNGYHAQTGGSYTLSEGTFSNEFHIYSMLWDDEKITWYIDDQLFKEISISSETMTEFHAPYFLIFNVAVGGNWPGSPDTSTTFPQRLVVDYIRVFQEK